ncbi:MAG: tRNA (N(6)-L-threonylcarbamoyladenosine(37)-C(2))-methylthiotransferase MtaB [Candidatus Omnitrophica bacterium]|nr:tRNA (N(6)-L-threonylcarbamoyladenosine(37)-C(2))-methylthiotransferase MtaB [Candidatus Omnitrophota bacterium]
MKVKFFTLGCKVNQYETQGLIEKFQSLGHCVTDGIADLYVINTCTVTSRADRKSRAAILKARKENPKAKIAVSGCLTQFNKDSIEKLGVDYVIAQDKKQSLVDIVLERRDNHKDIWSLKISCFYNHRAFVKVQDGCDNFCSFCKIPYLRGKPSSKKKEEVIKEIKKVSLSHREIVLCGINLGLYGKDFYPPQNLETLIEDILSINSLERLRLSSLEPYLVSDNLLGFLSHPKLCPHIHFPFQSGDDKILKEMNKRGDTCLYEEIVKKIRKINPQTAMSCDIMVGFPSEDEESFKNTVEFLKRIRPMRMHIFTFSPREETRFFEMKIKNQKSIHERFIFLKKLAAKFSLEYAEKFLGNTLRIVAEEKNNGYIGGYTENYIKVYLKQKIPLGEIYPVKIEKVEKDKVFASLN